ncbi:MAG: molecular chaperone TorD family protein [Nitrospirae bacterium]|nr:molecular chaperone TorD family protein [Nitrospirota bacterium]
MVTAADNTRAIETALARSRVYSLLSTAFFYPGEDLWALAASKDADGIVEQLGGALAPICEEEEAVWPALEALEASLADVRRGSLADLRETYNRLFSHAMSKECPPFETQYGGEASFQRMQVLADIAGFYKAFGLEASTDMPERCDHASLELEFLYVLTYKEAYALQRHGSEEADICAQAQRRFLREHLGSWAPYFARFLQKKAGNGFYGALARLLGAYLAWEMKFLDVTPLPLEHPEPVAEDGG